MNCTQVETDIRISKYHIAIQLAAVERSPDEGKNWQPAAGMLAWYSIKGTNGCILNGKKKRKGRIGRIYDGDTFYLFKDNSNGPVEFLGFKCEFTIGDHKREMLEMSDPESPVEVDGKRKGDYYGGGISMATTMAVATPKTTDALSIEGGQA
jgi:serine/threonine/tyrosine protein kinase RAD53